MSPERNKVSSILESCHLVSNLTRSEFQPLDEEDLMEFRLLAAIDVSGTAYFHSGSARYVETYDPHRNTLVSVVEIIGIANDQSSEHIFVLYWEDDPDIEVHVYLPTDGYEAEVSIRRGDDKNISPGQLKDGRYPKWHARIMGGLAAIASSEL